MQELYLIRHGQAGSRTDYDQLSQLGMEQAQRLADWFAGQRIRFDVIVSGGLKRQRATTAAFGAESITDELWNEFDLDAVYEAVAPQLARVDEEFRQAYETLRAESADPNHPVHRTWRPSDLAVVQAWMTNRFPIECETWQQFQQRIGKGFERIGEIRSASRIALVTSATPIGIATGSLFGSHARQMMELAGSLYNTSFTVFRRRSENWSLTGFNHTPHLGEEILRTLR